MPREARASVCPTNPAERVARAVVAVVLALAAAPAAFGAITGRCPIDFVRHRRRREPNTLGIAEARQPDRAGFAVVATAMKDCIVDPMKAARDEGGPTTEELEKLFLMLA